MAKKHISQDELNRILENTRNAQHRLMFRVMAGCGLRSHELVLMEMKHVDLEQRYIYIPPQTSKNHKEGYAVIPESLIPDLKRWMEIRNSYHVEFRYFWTNQMNFDKPLTTRAVRKAFNMACKKAGLKEKGYSPHSLRHFCAENMIRHGVDVNTIMHQLRHSSLAVTQIYLTNNLDERRKTICAANIQI